MPHTVHEACILAGILLISLVWLEVVPVQALGKAALVMLAWGAASTALVGAAAWWVALKRRRRLRG